MEFILISFGVFFMGFLYWNFIATYSYWKKRNVPSLPVLPLFGSYGDLITNRNTHISVKTKIVYDKYKNEKYIGAFKGTIPELIVKDPSMIKSVLINDFNYFMNRGLSVNEKNILDQHLFHLTGERWKALRQNLTPTFTSSKIRKMFLLIVECAEEMELTIKENLLHGSEIDMKELMSTFTIDNIGMCAFGLQMNALRNSNSPFRQTGKMISEQLRSSRLLRFLSGEFPILFKFFNIKVRRNQAELENFFVDLVKYLIKTRTGLSERHDFVNLILELRSKGSLEIENEGKLENEKIEITDELITAQLFVFFAAGFETSSTTMSCALREIAFNPDVQERLQREIDTVLLKYNGKLTYEAVQEMEYLDMVISETLRMYPPVPALNRVVNSAYKIPNTNIILDRGVKVHIPVLALHYDAKYFPEPEKFKPERFSSEMRNSYHPFSYLPFGEGPRNCIGARFGKLQSATGLISILRKFSVEPCSNTPKEANIDPFSTILSTVGGLPLAVKPRKLHNS